MNNIIGYPDTIIRDIDFTMSMEDMPLTEQDKQRLYDCITGKLDIEKVVQETIKKHTVVEAV
ncbi:hypothetical protein FACS1894190_08130 [Spirochaetia bacterium]|nr:hypothetical protein FACS1894190_08130 [Spirochaetia bacterium]